MSTSTEAAGWDRGTMDTSLVETDVPVRVDPDGDLPIYLQIKYQLSYLITTEKLKAGTRLPAVRNLASALGINAHTVAQAYRELQTDGMIDSTAGRGSFVRKFGDLDRAQAARHERLDSLLQGLRERARTLGFGDAEIQQRLASISQQQPVACHIAYVDRVPHTAVKYGRSLERHLRGAIRATPLSLEEVKEGSERAVEALSQVFYVVTVARNVPLLERCLATYSSVHSIVTIAAEILSETTAALAELGSDTRAVLLTEEPYIYSSLNMVSNSSALDPQAIESFTAADAEGFLQAASGADLILYTYGVSDMLADLDLPARGIWAPTLELAFDVAPDSVSKLRALFGVQELVEEVREAV